MTSSSAIAAPTSARATAPYQLDVAPIRPTIARTVLLHALALGIAADALFRDGPFGAGWAIWIALAALVAVSLASVGGRALHREAAAWLGVAVLAAVGMVWRDGGLLEFADFVVTVGALLMAAIALNHRQSALFAARLRETAMAIAFTLRAIVAGGVSMPLAARRDRESAAEHGGGTLAVSRAVLIALAVLLVFGTLLREADPIFASYIRLPDLDFRELTSHVLLIAFFAWLAAGWARAALGTDIVTHPVSERLPFTLGTLDVTTALGTLTVLFAAYLLSQLGWFFGGESLLSARTGLIVAQYARTGFFEMVWVVVLVVPLLLVTRALLRNEPGLARRHTMLALPLLALLAAMIVSAMLRMQLYLHYFGLTIGRFYALVLMGWLALLLVWLAATVLRDRGHYFAAGAAISGLVLLGALHVVTPDQIVARTDVARAASSRVPLDLVHLAALGGDAAPIAVRAVLETSDAPAKDRCAAAGRLQQKWGPTSWTARRAERESSWRTWIGGEREALRVVAANAPALRRVRHLTCTPTRR